MIYPGNKAIVGHQEVCPYSSSHQFADDKSSSFNTYFTKGFCVPSPGLGHWHGPRHVVLPLEHKYRQGNNYNGGGVSETHGGRCGAGRPHEVRPSDWKGVKGKRTSTQCASLRHSVDSYVQNGGWEPGQGLGEWMQCHWRDDRSGLYWDHGYRLEWGRQMKGSFGRRPDLEGMDAELVGKGGETMGPFLGQPGPWWCLPLR